MLGHVLVDVLRLDLEEEAVCVGIEQITPVPVLGLHLVVVEVIHQMLREVEDAHSHIHRMVEHQAALMHVDACQIIVEYVGTGTKAGLAIRRRSLSSSLALTSLMLTLLRRFSIVFPKTELFMSL